jgi:hypothetical protein
LASEPSTLLERTLDEGRGELEETTSRAPLVEGRAHVAD